MENNNSKSDLISYKELIYFKEEIFHSLKDFRKEVAEKIRRNKIIIIK